MKHKGAPLHGLVLIAALSGCASQGVDSAGMHSRASTALRTYEAPLMVSDLRLDHLSLPHFGKPLPAKPTTPGARYYLLTRQHGRPAVATAMVVCRARSEGYLLRTVKQGTALGAQMSTELMSMPVVPTGPSELHVIGSTMPLLLGVVGGLATGIAGTGSSGQADIVTVDIADLRFKYDEAGRLKTMVIRTGAGRTARSQSIEYHYTGDASLPAAAEPKPVPELLPENIEVQGCL